MNARALAAAVRRDRAIIIAALAVLTALAWTYIVTLPDGDSVGNMHLSAMPGMGAAMAPVINAWTAAYFGLVFTMWSVMMVGMMLPSVAPTILIYARIGRQAAAQGRTFASTGFFVAGYLLAWVGFSLVATVAQWSLARTTLLTPMISMATPLCGGLVLIAAGAYQWTPLKDRCLQHCQAPLRFIQNHGGFRGNPAGSAVIGLRHGMYCVGCCWMLMALLFVAGVMNVLWIAALTIFVLLEKIVPGRVVPRTAGVALMTWGLFLLTSALR